MYVIALEIISLSTHKPGKEQIHLQWADLSYTSLTYFNGFCLMKLMISQAMK